jgi:class 3 adenylate cyclase
VSSACSACRRRSTPTFLFADLVGYTALTEAIGDAAAADLAREFRRTMCALSRDRGARQVKFDGRRRDDRIGDAGEAVWLSARGPAPPTVATPTAATED